MSPHFHANRIKLRERLNQMIPHKKHKVNFLLACFRIFAHINDFTTVTYKKSGQNLEEPHLDAKTSI